MHGFINADFMRSLVVMHLDWRCRKQDGVSNSTRCAG